MRNPSSFRLKLLHYLRWQLFHNSKNVMACEWLQLKNRSQVIMTNEDANLSPSRRRLLPATASINGNKVMEEKQMVQPSQRWWSWKARGEGIAAGREMLPCSWETPERNEGGTLKGRQISAPVPPGSALCVRSLACIIRTYTHSLVYIVRNPLRTTQQAATPPLFKSM